MRFVLAGGGTGGHVYPGLALGEVLVERGWEVFYLTDPRAREYFSGEAVSLKVLHLRQLDRMGIVPLVLFASRLIYALGQSISFLWNYRPDLVVGLGGFVSFPPLLAARLLSFRTAVLEQNSVPGRVTRIFAPRVRQVHLSYSDSAGGLGPGKKIRVSGNPIRREVLEARRESCRAELGLAAAAPTVLVMGGSQGAHRLNLAVADWFRAGSNPLGIRFLVVTGVEDSGMVAEAGARFEPVPSVRPFVRRIGCFLAACDLVVSRAGATAMAEITARGLPAIFVPYPYAVDDHQRSNVEPLRLAGGCRVIDDGDLDGDRLRREVESLLGQPETLRRMAAASRSVGRPDAAGTVARALEAMVGGGQN